MVWGIFSLHTLGPLVPIEHHLNATANLSIVADHVHPFMTTVYLSSDATSRLPAPAGSVHDWGETLEQGTKPQTAPRALQCWLPTAPLGWVKCREHISLLIILCIIVYVTNKAHLSLICLYLLYFQQDNAPCHTAQITSDWFLEHDNEFTLLKWPPQSPDLNLRAPWGCGGTGDPHHGFASDKSAATAWCYHVNMEKKSLRNVSKN